MQRFLILFIFLFIVSCGGQSKEELLQEGNRLSGEGKRMPTILMLALVWPMPI